VPFGTDTDFNPSTVPPGRGYFPDDPRDFVPGYDRAIPPGRKPFHYRSARIKLALMRLKLTRLHEDEKRVDEVESF
jgi:hypothetical protein